MDRDEAIRRYNLLRDTDPFPDVFPALLNSADVHNYIETIGMVFPFDVEQLTGVTLSLKIGKTALYWTEKQEKVIIDIKEKREFILKSNTIAYVAIQEEIRLPAYIIARFNLRVTNAYKGILLATGPIVDPGFVGRLFIPLHNLTNNDYVFYPGDPFIDMEFTKISHNSKWAKKTLPEGIEAFKDGKYRGWREKPEHSDEREIEYYLRKANLGRPIESSLPSLKEETKQAIEKAMKVSDKVDTSLSRINVGLLFAFGALLTAIVAVVNIFKGDIRDVKAHNQILEQQIRTLENQHSQDIQTINLITDSLRNRHILPPQ
jgi:deoxycytidine triphosphate deaminase